MAEGGGSVKRLWAAQERRFALWSPVMIGLGVWLRLEGGWSVPWPVALGILVGFFGLSLRFHRAGAAVGALGALAVALICLGHVGASARVAAVSAPVLDEGFRGLVAGRVIHADRSRSNAPRVVLDRLSMAGLHPSAVPERVRLTLIDASRAPQIGSVIAINAMLGPPSGPAAPGAFDFSRQAFFRRIGGVGYARGFADIRAGPEQGDGLWLARWRAQIARTLRTRIGGDEGAVAAALFVGDRSGISDETTQELRDSGLAHLLAISGLHIGLMSALTFWLVRLFLAALPRFASRFPIRKIAAVAGLSSAAAYLALAGFGVATQRAFIMAAVAFVAILLDRPAVTARGLSAAACLVLLLRPESLFEAGFQMSFAAVAALVAGYEVTQPFWRGRSEDLSLLQRFCTGFVAVVATSIMAGAATAPFAAYHFNRLVAYGLPANVLATPVMGLWIMPAIILTALLTPFGLAGVGLAILGWGIAYVLWVAEFIAALEGAAMSVHAGTPLALALIVFGGLWLVIWRGVLRGLAVLPILSGVLLWQAAERPDVLIAEDARLIAARGVSGALWVSRERKSGYSAETWLRRNGEGDVPQADAYARRLWSCDRTTCQGEAGEGASVILLRRDSVRDLKKHCAVGTIVIAPRLSAAEGAEHDCTLIDKHTLARASSMSLTFQDSGVPPLIQRATPTRLGRE